MLKDITPLKNPHSSQNKNCNDLDDIRLMVNIKQKKALQDFISVS